MSFRFGAGGSDNLSVGAVDILNGTGPYSISCYGYVNSSASSSRGALQVKAATTGNAYFGFNATSANLWRFGFEDAGGLFPEISWTTGFAAGTWHSVVGTYDGTTQLLYADGSPGPVGTNTPAAARRAYTGAISTAIGNYTALTGSWDGLLCEVAVWNRALTPFETAMASQLVTPWSPTLFAGLTHYFPMRFDERDVIAGQLVTVTGAVLSPEHPAVVLPSLPRFGKKAVVPTLVLGASFGRGFNPGRTPSNMARFYTPTTKGFTPAATTTIFRKTLSSFGSRTSGRQTHNS